MTRDLAAQLWWVQLKELHRQNVLRVAGLAPLKHVTRWAEFTPEEQVALLRARVETRTAMR